jgi:polyhydroxyalkanoate synthase subunit PhaC
MNDDAPIGERMGLPAVLPPPKPAEPPVADFRHAAPDPKSQAADSIDRVLQARLARLTGGISPMVLASAWLDWGLHLALSPGRRAFLVEKAARKLVRYGVYGMHALSGQVCEECIIPLPQDRRFRGPEWQKLPYNMIYQGFLLTQQWWHNATTEVSGVSRKHEEIVSFMTRQLLDIVSPANFIQTNPTLMATTLERGGMNLAEGWQNLIEDASRAILGKRPAGSEAFEPGRDVALTEGKVIYRNRLMELIQYAPRTSETRPEPILIVPAWIMKYYILDLSPGNSLARYLVERGYTVFMISWKNPIAVDRDLGLDDYLKLGVLAGLDAVQRVLPGRPAHLLGYCLGGTLAAIAAAALAQKADGKLKSLTLLAGQTDFTEAGELMLFITDHQVSYLENMMWDTGYLDTTEMAGAFQILRSNDLIWSRMAREYLQGERRAMNDLMAWNADATRLPFRMHSEYLRSLFLDNDLAAGRYMVDGRPIALSDIAQPIFAVGTTEDHVAPWRSVYKIHLLADAEVTFALTNGGHNAGIISQPGHDRRHYRLATKPADEKYQDPESWLATHPSVAGSWWPALAGWLDQRSGPPGPPPAMGAPADGLVPLYDAPGIYVREP